MTHPIRDEQDLIQRVAAMRVRLDALEAENAALREFVAVYDEVDAQLLNADAFEALALDAWCCEARQRLATEFGLPLPEVELADDASDDEQHHGPVCSLCGASILFAGFDLCTNCERGMLDD